MIGALAASGATLAGAALAAPASIELATLNKDADAACLYHCDFGDPQRFSAMLQNMNNHYSAYDFDTFRLKLVIVAHSAGIKFFLGDLAGTPWEKDVIDPDLYKRVAAVAKYGAEVYLCRITYQRLNIDPAKTRSDAFLKLVPSGVAAVAALQSKGFAYLKTG
jgi:intracellular sulfur oxidation DsrE/DsrF family protein